MPDQNMTINVARQHALGDIPRRTAARYPDRPALIDGEMRLTYADFDDVINRTANALLTRGVVNGDRVALLSHNCWQFPVLSYACARIGAILVPINFMLSTDEVAFILSHSGAHVFVCEEAMLDVARAACAKASTAPTVLASLGNDADDGWESFARWAEHPDATAPTTLIDDDDPVRMMYTSGTESQPKGALLTSRSLMWQYVSCVIDGGMSSDDVDLHALPLYHCAQMDCFLGPDVYIGAQSIIAPGPHPETLLRLIEEHGVTKFFAPPTVWIALLRSPAFDQTDLSSLQKGYYGASAMPVEILKEIRERLPTVKLWNFYGQTELAPVATILQPHEQEKYPGAAGRPVINVETRVVDDDDNPLPTGEVGEIVHRTPQALIEYFRAPAQTAAAFKDGWFHSGDLGYFDEDGILRVVDRKKDMIKTGGENVASREVEEALYRHAAVAEAAVFGVPDTRWVEAVAAVVVLKAGHSATEDELVSHVRGILAGYKTPKRVFFTVALPKNPSGKILKRDLRLAYSATETTNKEVDTHV